MSVRILGLDEVNKGECFGPIFITACYKDFKTFEDFQDLPHFGDSKSAKKLDSNNLDQILKLYELKFASVQATVKQIDTSANLNELISAKQKELIERIRPDFAYIDCHVYDRVQYKKELQAEYPYCSFKVDFKLDEKISLTGLASLICKNQKKNWVSEIEARINLNIGSGNLTDLKTINLIKSKNPILEEILRKKWDLKSLKRHIEK